MGRRQLKQTRVSVIRFLARARRLTDQQAAQLEAMARRCRTPAEFKQVSEIVDRTCHDNQHSRWAQIAAGDPFGIEDPDD